MLVESAPSLKSETAVMLLLEVLEADISVIANNGGVAVTAGTGNGAYGQIGNGGVSASGVNNGTILVDAQNGAVALKGGDTADFTHVMIGHGGTSVNGNQGDADDTITVLATTDVSVVAGDQNNSFAMIGMGGLANNGTAMMADITVVAGSGNVTLEGGDSSEDDGFAMIGKRRCADEYSWNR